MTAAPKSLLSRIASAFRGDRPLAERPVAELEELLREARREEQELGTAVRLEERVTLAGTTPEERRDWRGRLDRLRDDARAATDTTVALEVALRGAKDRERQEQDAASAARFSTASPFPPRTERILALRAELNREEDALASDLDTLFRPGVRALLTADPLAAVRELVRRLLGDRVPPSARVAFESGAAVLPRPAGPKEGDRRRRIGPDTPRQGIAEVFEDGAWHPATAAAVRAVRGGGI